MNVSRNTQGRDARACADTRPIRGAVGAHHPNAEARAQNMAPAHELLHDSRSVRSPRARGGALRASRSSTIPPRHMWPRAAAVRPAMVRDIVFTRKLGGEASGGRITGGIRLPEASGGRIMGGIRLPEASGGRLRRASGGRILVVIYAAVCAL